MAAHAGLIAVESALAILAACLVFAEGNVLVLALATYVETMTVKECIRQSLEATFGRARSLFGHALLVRESDVGSTVLVYLSGAVSRSAIPGRGLRKSSMERETLVHLSSRCRWYSSHHAGYRTCRCSGTSVRPACCMYRTIPFKCASEAVGA